MTPEALKQITEARFKHGIWLVDYPIGFYRWIICGGDSRILKFMDCGISACNILATMWEELHDARQEAFAMEDAE